ncbi:MAG: hypothetical protein NT151_06750 [Acidobacteria bacterium]|nr:hypothetical protein [Acidobacteriota bacterium]
MESQCAQNAKQDQLFNAVARLNNNYESRVSKGEAGREVYGLPCAATASNPAEARAIEQYLDMVYKNLGLTRPPTPVVR